ncbi:hypothetical protein [Microcoleus phage My-WqHQDG]|nr:hypothetical protein [Microcoleus phage My-WqHQDG]
MPFNIPSPQQYPWDAPLAKHLAQLSNPTQGGINTWAITPTLGVDGVALGINHVGYTGINTSTANIEQWNGTSWVALIDSAKVVSGNNISFYVNQATGSDTNNGMSPTTAWRTTSKLYQEMRAYSFQERAINIYLGPGSYRLLFPSNTSRLTINVVGESSASVNLASMVVYDQLVTIKGLTVSYPELTSFATLIQCIGAGALRIGSDIVLGNCGPSGVYFYIRNSSQVILYPNCPITVTHNSTAIFYLSGSSWGTFTCYIAPSTATPVVPAAPAVNTGIAGTSVLTPLVAGEIMTAINFVGTRTVSSAVIVLENTSKFEGAAGIAQLKIAGTVTGLAYRLTNASYLNTSTYIGDPIGTSIGFSSTLSAGSMSADSYVSGTRNI